MKTRETRQKQIIQEKLRQMNKFFTAEDLLYEIKKKDPKIGIATVYRFLKDSSKEEHIHSFECNRKKLYSAHAESHCHFTCEKCGKVEHFSIQDVGFLTGKIKGDICHFQINVNGLCEKCRNK